MYRKRLKSRDGCLRCKSRRVKCDEAFPKCSFCARWHVECVRPLDGAQVPNRAPINRQQTLTSSEELRLDSSPQSIILRSSLGPTISIPSFCEGPSVFGSTTHAEMLQRIRSFAMSILDHAFPFNVTAGIGQLGDTMFNTVLADEAAYYSLAAHILTLPRNCAPDPITTELGQRFEKKTLSLLRHRIESGMSVTDGTLTAAALHGAGMAFQDRNKSSLNKVAGGIRALVQARAAENTMNLVLDSSISISLRCFDLHNSFVNVEGPLFGRIPHMPQPASLNRVSTSLSQDERLAECLDPNLMGLLKDLRLLLSFRVVNRSTQSLSPNEALYIFYLYDVIDHGLMTSQALYADTHSVAEIAILGMSLLKLKILPNGAVWPIHGNVIRQRLTSAISVYQTHAGTCMFIVLWSCTMALLEPSPVATRDHFLDLIFKILTDQARTEQWPVTWSHSLAEQLQQILWHESFDFRFNAVCLELQHWQRERLSSIEAQT